MNYTVSKEKKSGLWYAHQKGLPHVPVFGSLCQLWFLPKDFLERGPHMMGYVMPMRRAARQDGERLSSEADEAESAGQEESQ